MKKIAVITTTRAEYGLLSPLIKELRRLETEEFKTELVVSGTHLSEEFGKTINEINDRIDRVIPISVKSASEMDISANQAEALIKFTELFSNEKYVAIVILGDRYETLAIAIAAGNTRTPIFHLCGGDTTEGAMDEWIRHSITKMSYLHFVTNEDSERRVIQLGEDPSRVFNYGSTSIDNILASANMTRAEALQSVGLSDCKYAICTYHPETMDNGNIESAIREFLLAIESYPQIEFIVTKSNADQGGSKINELLDLASKEINNLHVFASLGMRRYLSLMKYSSFVLGNSSSGIIEAPAFKVPTINIGNRQRGRLQSKSIINCGASAKEIIMAIERSLSDEHKAVCASTTSLYGDGSAAIRIAEKCVETIRTNIDLKKKFYKIGW